MSIRLTQGLALKDSTADIFSVVPAVAKLVRRELAKAAEALVGQELALRCDEATFRENIQALGSFRHTVETEWRKEQAAYGEHHRLHDPLRFSMVFGRTAAGGLLAYPYYEHRGYGSALKRSGIFRSYGYWNHTDRPVGVSKTSWEARKSAWEELLDAHDTFGTLPLWTLGQESDPWRSIYLQPPGRQDLNSYRNQEERLRRFLRLAAATPLVARYGKDNFMRALREANDHVEAFMATPEGVALPRPEPLPATFAFTLAELPPIYSVKDETVAAILATEPERA